VAVWCRTQGFANGKSLDASWATTYLPASFGRTQTNNHRPVPAAWCNNLANCRSLRCYSGHVLPDAAQGDKPAKKKFKSYPIGYFHIDIAEVQTAEGRRSSVAVVILASLKTLAHSPKVKLVVIIMLVRFLNFLGVAGAELNHVPTGRVSERLSEVVCSEVCNEKYP